MSNNTMSKLNIPILDLQPEIEEHWDEFMDAIQGVLRSGQFIMGPNTKAFEREVAEYLGVKHAIGVNSGTDALVIGLRALGIGPGDEVITSPFTFFATAEAVSAVGATPVFVDIDRDSLNIDANKIADVITPRTKAIIPIHIFGLPADMETIMGLARKYNLKVIEDCAQSFGADFGGRQTGTIGDVGCFSFFPSKNLGAFGDGGLIVTNDDEVADAAKMLRTHGSRKKYYNETVGYNSRLDEVQAAVLRVKLKFLDRSNEGRRETAEFYNDTLGRLPGVQLQRSQLDSRHVYHQYTIRVPVSIRNNVISTLSDRGIQTMIYYPVPVHKLPVYKELDNVCPNAEACSSEVFSLPIWPKMPKAVAAEVVNCIKAALYASY